MFGYPKIDPTGMSREFFRKVGHQATIMFFRGQIDGAIKQFKKGVGILSKELDIKLVPAYIDGAYKAWPRGQRWPHLYKTSVHFGKPFTANELCTTGYQLGAQDDYEAIVTAIRKEVIKLAPK